MLPGRSRPGKVGGGGRQDRTGFLVEEMPQRGVLGVASVRHRPRLRAGFVLALWGLIALLPASAFCEDIDLAKAILEWRDDWPDVSVKVPIKVYRLYMQSLLKPEPERLPRGPVDYVIPQAEHAASIDHDMLRLRVRADVTLMSREDVKPIPILPAGIPWEGIQLNGKDAVLREEGGWLHLDNPAEAAFADAPADAPTAPLSVSARVDLRAAEAAGTFSVSLPIAQAVRSLLKVDSDEAWEVMTPSSPLSIVGTEDGTHGVLALMPHAGKGSPTLQVTWRRPRPPVSRLGNAMYHGYVAWHLGEGAQEVRARLDVRIVGGERDSVEIALPRGADRVSVTGPDVREVRVGGQSATVHLKGGITGLTRLDVEFTVPWAAGKGKVSLGEFGIRDGRLEGGSLIITCGVGGVVLGEEVQGLHDLGLWDIPKEAASLTASQPVLAYRFAGGNWSAVVDVVSVADFPMQETLIDEAQHTVLLRADGAAMHKVLFRMRNQNRQFLKVRLPGAEDQLIAARVAERPVPVSRDADGSLLIPLEKSEETMAGGVSFPVELVFLRSGPALERSGRLSLALACADVPAAQAKCTLYLPEGFRARRWQGPFRLSEKLAAAVEQLEYGRGHLAVAQRGEPPVTKEERAELLARGYLQAAKGAYESGEIDKADRAARSVLTSAPGTVHAEEAQKLLGNIVLLRGERKAEGKRERVLAEQLRQGQAEVEQQASVQQEQLLRQARQMAREGKESAAAESYRAAEQLTKGLSTTQAGREQQKEKLAEARDWLGGYEEQAKLNVELRRQRQSLLEKSREPSGMFVAGVAGYDIDRSGVVAGTVSAPATDGGGGVSEKQIIADLKQEVQRIRERGTQTGEGHGGDYGYLALKPGAETQGGPAGAYGTAGAALGVQAGGQIALQRAARKVGPGRGPEQSLRAENVKLKDQIEELEKKPELPGPSQGIAGGFAAVNGALPAGPARPGDENADRQVREAADELIAQERYAEAAEVVEKAKKALGEGPVSRPFITGVAEPEREFRGIQKGYVSPPTPGMVPGRTEAAPVPPAAPAPPAGERVMESDQLVSRLESVQRKDQIASRSEKEQARLEEKTAETIIPYKDLIVHPDKPVWKDQIASRSEMEREKLSELESRIKQKREEAGGTVFNVGDLVKSEAEGRALADFLGRNVEVADQPGARPAPAAVAGRVSGGIVEYQQGQVRVRGRAGDEQILNMLDNLRRNLGQKVTVNTRDLALSESAVADLGVQWNSMKDGRWAMVDEGQLRALMSLEQRVSRPGQLINRRQREVVPGTAAELTNKARVQLDVVRDTSNYISLPDARVELPHEEILLVSNDKGIVAVRAGATQFWTEAPKAPEIEEVPMEINVPAVGVPVWFEKVLVRPEDALVIECTYSYEEER